MPLIIYKDSSTPREHSWIKYLLQRIKANQNNLVVVAGKTGSGKTWSAISICEIMSKITGWKFTVDDIIFSLKDLMKQINEAKPRLLIFDEPQVSISAREFQAEANRVFNYLLTTFRHKNITLFFCTPFEDLLDKTARKLFHAKFTTMSINKNTNTCRLKPLITEYNSSLEKWYTKCLRICYKPKGKSKYTTVKLRTWEVPKPNSKIIELYEKKKLEFTTELNERIERRLNKYDEKQTEKFGYGKEDSEFAGKESLSEAQLPIFICWKEGVFSVKKIADKLGKHTNSIHSSERCMRKKGYYKENYQIDRLIPSNKDKNKIKHITPAQ